MKDVTKIDPVIEEIVLPISNEEAKCALQNVVLTDIGLTLSQEDTDAIMSLYEHIGDMDTLSVAEYGKDISSNTNNCTKEVLSLVNNKDLDETGTKLNEIVSVAKGINSANFIGKQSSFSRLPVIGGLFKSVAKAKDNFITKFHNTDDQINSLVNEIEVNQQGLKERIHVLESMFENVNNDYRALGLHIAAGRLKLEDIQKNISDLSNGNKDDVNVIQKIYDQNAIANNLEKRLHDLHVLQQSALQTLPMIRLIQSNSTMLIDKFYAIKSITIPSWRNQITLALTLNEQKNSVELANAIDEATNSLLKRNAELLHTNSNVSAAITLC